MADPDPSDGNLDARLTELKHATAAAAAQADTALLDDAVWSRGGATLPVVALGGSAGAIQALQAFFDSAAPTSGIAYVVVLHLAPEHHSTMPELLQRRTAMPVRAAEDGDRLEANRVYVIPPGRHLVAADGHLRLTPMRHERGKRVAVDLFLRSLADTHGPHATAIVLSGADGDGAIGLKRIKERGGLTIAQDPREAEHAGMPSSAIATGMVDWVLPSAEMPARIVAYLASATNLRLPSEDGPPPARPSEPTPDRPETLLSEVLAFLRSHTGRDFTYYKRATIVRRVSRRMQVTGVENLGAYLSHLRTHLGESGALLQDLLISVTNFFRDRDAFGSLEAFVPELFVGKNAGDSVRVWCAACATGEEAYSMAMLLLEHAQKLPAPPNLQVFGCDLDEGAIKVARAGFYPDTIAADVSDERLHRFFTKEPSGWRVRRELREMVLFANHDLLKDAPFSRMDLVSCRNLLIYLNRDAQARALDIFHFALNPRGLLFLGTSESVDEEAALFEPVDKKHRVFRHRAAPRTGVPLSVDATDGALQRVIRQHEHLRQATTVLPGRFGRAAPAPVSAAPADAPGPAADQLHFRLLGRFGPPSLVVDAEHDVVHLSENANRFLQMPEGEPTRNLLRLVHPALRVELRAALLRAEETGQPVDVPRHRVDLQSGPLSVGMRVTPAGDLSPGALLVLFDGREAAPPNRAQAADAPGAFKDSDVVRQLERELSRTQEMLRGTVEEYETATEEFKASNEELQAMNEELRSAGEELETGREELQSVNEELTTVNAEFRNRVEELARANSDLHNLMSATRIATVFLSRTLEVMRYTPAAAPLFNLIPGDVGRPITHLNQQLDYPELAADAAQVLRTLVPIEREMREDGHWYLARVLPYRTVEDQIAGVVLTFHDITERRRAEMALRTSDERWRLLIESARDYAIFTLDTERRITSWSAGAVEMIGFEESEIIGHVADIIFTPEDRAAGAPEREVGLARDEGRAGNERFHLRKDGTRFYGSGTVRPLRDPDGAVIGFVKIMRDLTEQRRAEEAVRESEERQAFLLQLSDALRPLSDVAAIEGEACRLLAQHLGTDRAFYREFRTTEGVTLVRRDYVRGTVPSLQGTHPIADVAWMLPLDGRGRPVVVTDVRSAVAVPETHREAAAAAHVAWVVVPLMRKEQIVATLCVADMKPRAWTAAEVEITRDTAERLWATVERAGAAAARRESEERYRSLFDSMDQGYCIVQLIFDGEGRAVDWRYVEVNPAFEKHTGLVQATGRTVRELVPAIEPKWMEIYGRVAATGESLRFQERSATLGGRVFDLYAFRVGEPGERKVAILFTDITDGTRHAQRQAFLIQLNDALRPLADPYAIKATATRLLGEFLSVNRAFYADAENGHWRVTPGYLQGSESLPDMRYPMSDYGPWIIDDFRAGRSLVVADVVDEARFRPAERTANQALQIRAAAAVPLVKEGELVAMLCLHSATPRDWNVQDLALLQETADRTWDAVERARADQASRQSEARLEVELADTRSLQRISGRLVEEDDVDALYDEILEAARSLMRSDFASLQQLVPEPDGLFLLAHKGFVPEAARHWEWVSTDESTSCSLAMSAGERVIIADVERWQPLDGTKDLDAYRLCGIRAVQSTRLVSRSGRLVGMISTHWRDVHEPTERALSLLAVLARQTADLIERRAVQEALRQSERTFSALVDNAPFGVYLVDAEFRLRTANAGSQPVFQGIEPLLGRDFAEILRILWPEPFAREVIGRFHHTLRTGESFVSPPVIERRANVDEIQAYDWQLHRVMLPDGSYGVVCYFYDLTDQKRLEAAVRVSEARMRAMAKNLPGGAVFVVDHDLRYQVAGGEALDTAAQSVGDFVGRTVAEVVEPALLALHTANYRRALAGETFAHEHESSGRHFHTRGAPLHDEDGRVTSALAVSYDITDRKRAEEALQASETRLRTLADAVPQVIWTNTGDGFADYFNKRWHEYTGLSLEASQGPGWQAVVHPDDAVDAGRSWHRALESGVVFDHEYRLRGADGRYRWFIGRNVPVHDDGRVSGWFGTATDIDELKHAETALRASEEQFRRAIEDAPIPVIMQAEDGTVLQVSRAWTALTGYGPEDMRTFDAWLSQAYGAGADVLRQHVQQLFGGEASRLEVELDVTTRSGDRRFWSFSASAPGLLSDGRRFLVGMAQDITERREAEAALLENRERLQLIVENAREYAIVSMDVERRITSWNAGAEAMLGHTQEQALGRLGDMIFTPEDRAAKVPALEAGLVLAEGRASDERWHLRRDGGRFWGSGVMTAMRDASGKPIGLVKIFRDQTSELLAKEALEQSRAELRAALQETEAARDQAESAGKAKDRFLAILSHELRTPLTPLLLAVQVLSRNKALPANALKALDIVQRNVFLETQLIDDLLDVTRIATGKLELVRAPATLRDIVEGAVEVSTPDIEAKGQRLSVALAPGDGALFGDAKRLQQVFWNLLKNASKFTPKGGAITLASHLEPGRVVVQVQDTGAGFEPEAAARIFTAFEQESARVTREYGGLGLGLAIARASVEAHGGTIRAESAGAGRGATFAVELPLQDPAG